MEKLIIGVDNGYGFTKTVHSTLVSSLIESESEPTFKNNVICYDGRWYYLGQEPNDILNDKTENDNTYILTLMAIAEELKVKGITSAHVYLSVGLPLTKFSAQRDAFRKYFTRNNGIISFNYEDVNYKIEIDDNIIVSPQGYAAVVPMLSSLQEELVLVDIGTWTIDILPLKNNIPIQDKTDSLNEGIKTLIDSANKELRGAFGNGIPSNQIQKVILKNNSTLNAEYKNIVEKEIRKYAEHIVGILGGMFNTDITSFVFIGGGASVIKNYGIDLVRNGVVIPEINVNAVGYEFIAKNKLMKEKGGRL